MTSNSFIRVSANSSDTIPWSKTSPFPEYVEGYVEEPRLSAFEGGQISG
jgi:hypothetical protein